MAEPRRDARKEHRNYRDNRGFDERSHDRGENRSFSPERNSRAARDRGHREDRNKWDERSSRGGDQRRDSYRDSRSNHPRGREDSRRYGNERDGVSDSDRHAHENQARRDVKQHDRERDGERNAPRIASDEDRDTEKYNRERDLERNARRAASGNDRGRQDRAADLRAGGPARDTDSIRSSIETARSSVPPPKNGSRGEHGAKTPNDNLDEHATPVNIPLRKSRESGHDQDKMDVDKDGKGGSADQQPADEEDYDSDEPIAPPIDPAMAGFGFPSGFGSSKNKQVPGNNVSAIRKEKTTQYRQYMNRNGGFNRELSPPKEG